MSALFNANTKRLDASFGTDIDISANTVGLIIFEKWDSAESHNSLNYMMRLAEDSSTTVTVGIYSSSAPSVLGQRSYTSNMTVADGALVEDSWTLCAVWTDIDDGTFQDVAAYNGSASGNTANSLTTGSANDLGRVSIGQDVGSTSNYSRFKGRLAEASIWLGKTQAEFETIIGECLTKTADNVAGHSPDHYWPLESDATASAGGLDLTNNGTVTFSSGDHPTLTGPGGGGGGSPAGNAMHGWFQRPWQGWAPRLPGLWCPPQLAWG